MSSSELCPPCGGAGRLTCSRCHLVGYCSKEHQLAHWKQHKPICRPFKVERSKELGRHLIASRELPSGCQLISEPPLVAGPKSAESLCLGCCTSLDPHLAPRCSDCEWPICDSSCPGLTRYHLPFECKILRLNLEPAQRGIFNYEAILPLRCLLLQKLSPKKWEQLLSMESHAEERRQDLQLYREVDEKIVVYLQKNYLSYLDAGILENTTSEILHRISGIIEVNSLEISTGVGEVSGLYPTACLMEHSCLPNVRLRFELQDLRIIVEASEDISRGDHVSTMYTHMLWGTAARREHLLRSKYFTCSCPRCVDPTELGTHFSSLRCVGASSSLPGESCGGIVSRQGSDETSDWSCSDCPLVLSSSHVYDLVSRIGAQVDAAMETPTVDGLDRLLDNLEKLLHPNHYHCFTVAHSLVQLWGRESGYQLHQLPESLLLRKIEMCRALRSLTERLDRGGVRTGLYSAVCLLELSTAAEELSRRPSAAGSAQDRERGLRQGRDALEEALRLLAPLADHQGPAEQLVALARASHSRLQGELNKYRVIEIL